MQAQLYQLKTNKEYNVMLQQIQDSKADASLVEDKILEAMDKIDKAKLNVDAEKKKLLEEEKFFNEQKAKLENELKEIEQSACSAEGNCEAAYARHRQAYYGSI